MDPLQDEMSVHLGHVTEAVAQGDPTGAPMPAEAPPAAAGPTSDQRQSNDARRRFDRGGRRRADWPEDGGLSCCPGCGFENIQSLGMLDSGDYLWQCPRCDRRFQTGRATRTML
jgi:hypothetical protein